MRYEPDGEPKNVRRQDVQELLMYMSAMFSIQVRLHHQREEERTVKALQS